MSAAPTSPRVTEQSHDESVVEDPATAALAKLNLEGEGGDDEDEESQAYDGTLPDFSDEESTAVASKASSSRMPLGHISKGPPGKKRLPLSHLKKKLGSAATPAKKNKQKAGDSSSAVVQGNGDKEERSTEVPKGMQLSDDMLNKVMARLVADQGDEGAGLIQKNQVQELINQIGLNKNFLQGKQGLMGKGAKATGSHKFWATQPVTKLGTPAEEIKEGPLEPNKADDQIRKEPLELHKDFRWVNIDLGDKSELREVYELLSNHYVEDEDASFRFDYSPEFFEWALKPPGYIPDWHIGVRVAATGKLIAFISGIPIDLRVRAITKRCTEINFLCVHKKLRSKRLAPILIQEVTRRTHLRGIFQAIYTAGVFLPTPVSRCQYYHRSLNPAKLVKTGFTAIPRNSTVARMTNVFRLPESTSLPGLREMEKKDLKPVARLLRAYLARMDMAPLLSNKDVEHALLAGRGHDIEGKREGQVTWAYVVEDPESHEITDVFSFYSLPSTATKIKPVTHINAAYLFYYATTANPSCSDLGDGSMTKATTHWKDETSEERSLLKNRLRALIGDALVIASKQSFDVFNALTLQDNALVLEDLKFGRGDGFLHYYLYNYATKPIMGGIDSGDGGSGVGVVML